MLSTTIKESTVNSNDNHVFNSGNTTNYSITITTLALNANNNADLEITPVISQDFRAHVGHDAGSSASFSASNTLTSPSQDFNVGTKLPFLRNRNFCGREDVLSRLYDIVEPQGPAERPTDASQMSGDVRTNCGRKTVILCGLGGTGKSQIALEYAYRFSDYYTSILWIDADDVSPKNESAFKIVEQLVRHHTTKRRSPLMKSQIPYVFKEALILRES
ncbi:hypothetical protein RUND412_005830 [Rhizina undulata]